MSPKVKRALAHQAALNALFSVTPAERTRIVAEECKIAASALKKFKDNRELAEPGSVSLTKDELEAIQIKLKLPPDVVPSKLYGQQYVLVS